MSFRVVQNGVDAPIPFYSNVYAGQTYSVGQGVISLRFDDGSPDDYAVIFPLLTARSLTAGFAIVRNRINNAEWISLAQILEIQAAGMEIMCHSRTHGVDPASLAAFKDETLKAASEMWMIGIQAVSFVQPGSWVAAYHLDDPAEADATADSFLRSYFAAYEAYGTAFDVYASGIGRSNLPRSSPYGVSHNTGDALTLETLQGLVDLCVTNGQGTEILFHANNIGGDGYISLADFTTFLDYLQTKVGTGDIVVLTPTQQLFAMPT